MSWESAKRVVLSKNRGDPLCFKCFEPLSKDFIRDGKVICFWCEYKNFNMREKAKQQLAQIVYERQENE